MALGITFGAGQRVSASDLNAIVTQVNSLTSPPWTSFTPTLTASGTAFSLGNGSAFGRYRRPAGSDLIVYEGKITWGTTTSNGTGFYTVNVPVNADASASTVSNGTCQIFDNGTARRLGQCWLSSASAIGFISASGDVTNTSPQTFASSDFISWQITYMPA